MCWCPIPDPHQYLLFAVVWVVGLVHRQKAEAWLRPPRLFKVFNPMVEPVTLVQTCPALFLLGARPDYPGW
jgi:hypothetical protein